MGCTLLKRGLEMVAQVTGSECSGERARLPLQLILLGGDLAWRGESGIVQAVPQ